MGVMWSDDQIAGMPWVVALSWGTPYIGYADPEGGGTVTIAVLDDDDDYDTAEFIVREHNTRLMQIETKNQIILELRQEKAGMHRKIGDLEARNQRLHDEKAELDRQNSDLGWELYPEEYS